MFIAERVTTDEEYTIMLQELLLKEADKIYVRTP